jgi:hypothetical protein
VVRREYIIGAGNLVGVQQVYRTMNSNATRGLKPIALHQPHGRVLGSIPGVSVFILRNNHEVDVTQRFFPEAGFPLCCRFIKEELFRDLLSPNG